MTSPGAPYIITPVLTCIGEIYTLEFEIKEGIFTTTFDVECPQTIALCAWEAFLQYLQEKPTDESHSLTFSILEGMVQIVLCQGVVELYVIKYGGETSDDMSIKFPATSFIIPLYTTIFMMKQAKIWSKKETNGS